MPPGKVSRYPRKTRKPGAPASAVRRPAGSAELMAQARYDWNKATPKEPPSILTASPQERASAVARTPGATETLAQNINAGKQGRANSAPSAARPVATPTPTPKPKPQARPARPPTDPLRNKLDPSDGTPPMKMPVVQDAATKAKLEPARARGKEINARVQAKLKQNAKAKQSQQKRTAGKRSAN